MGVVDDPDTGRRKLWALLVTLSLSRHLSDFVWPTFEQTTASREAR